MRLSRRLRQRIGAISKAICPWMFDSSSPAAVTSWFAGKVPFHFQLPESQQTGSGQQIYRLVGSRADRLQGQLCRADNLRDAGTKNQPSCYIRQVCSRRGRRRGSVWPLNVSRSQHRRFQSDYVEQPRAYVRAGFLVARFRAAVVPRMPPRIWPIICGFHITSEESLTFGRSYTSRKRGFLKTGETIAVKLQSTLSYSRGWC